MISWLTLSWTNSFRQAIHTGTSFPELLKFLILWWTTTTLFDMFCWRSCSVNEGYLTYTKFRALQHFSSAMLHVLSTQVNFLVAVIFYLVIRFIISQLVSYRWIVARFLDCSNYSLSYCYFFWWRNIVLSTDCPCGLWLSLCYLLQVYGLPLRKQLL
jgi:hypothetical protein